MDNLVTCQWLEDHLNDGDLVVLDCSVSTTEGPDGPVNSSGHESYLEAHVPGAGFANLKDGLTTDAPVEFTPLAPSLFCEAMGALGVGDRSRVVLYDSSHTAWAARVWWMLRWVGFDNAAILDGGLNAWKAAGLPLATGPVERAPQDLTLRPRPELIATKGDILDAMGDDGALLVDTLPPDLYSGKLQLYARAGHIPGAVNLFGLAMLDENGRFRKDEALAAMHAGIGRDKQIITYCGGGILASLNAFALTRLGYRNVSVYTASMQEWAADPALPIKTGNTP